MLKITEAPPVSELLKILKTKDARGLQAVALELVKSEDGRKAITVDFVEQLTEKPAYLLAIALRGTPEGRDLLAKKPKITDTLLEKDPKIASILVYALKDTVLGLKRLQDDVRFVEVLLKYDPDNVGKALGEIIAGNKQIAVNGNGAIKKTDGYMSKEVRKSLEGIAFKGREDLSYTPKHSKKAAPYAGKGI